MTKSCLPENTVNMPERLLSNRWDGPRTNVGNKRIPSAAGSKKSSQVTTHNITQDIPNLKRTRRCGSIGTLGNDVDSPDIHHNPRVAPFQSNPMERAIGRRNIQMLLRASADVWGSGAGEASGRL